jgi:hypothetical protein
MLRPLDQPHTCQTVDETIDRLTTGTTKASGDPTTAIAHFHLSNQCPPRPGPSGWLHFTLLPFAACDVPLPYLYYPKKTSCNTAEIVLDVEQKP